MAKAAKAPKAAKEQNDFVIIATNKKASHNYNLIERYEAGLVLIGSEIKSIRKREVNLSDGYVEERSGELWLLNVHIPEYAQAHRFGHEPRRPRKLLLHRKEIAHLIGKLRERGYTIVPTRLYLKHGRAKVEIAVAKGKKEYDKRHEIAKRDADLEIRRRLKEGRFD
ncbi:MAG: SsrA-binding protein [Candidatus Thermofonsia Clade 1 bacterium]|jgi:SsrA-binding protein|uniref:SsrA-binding protein n=1 Tax=Candidatus Thermofonsia Clade 1 bacterium TaxID=2364210 RepID=A0A2M8PZV2_9CHLR|nr:MAG: SsrA-binding protein [Candidatus Thermofonsia Clade 1 bacterium]PJF43071.1 MAG: SsrA-binding protein [Candidatus Thermofonsia Clade 1 bacterium]RMF50838.1 MAG: SsrA-binding protein SmpB [Chloroflexota bacterium]